MKFNYFNFRYKKNMNKLKISGRQSLARGPHIYTARD